MGVVYLIRHGEVAWNRESAYVGFTDLPLNDKGRKQAERVAEYLAGRDLSAVYASDLSRALSTAEMIAARSGVDVRVARELREVNYGDWEGVPELEIDSRFGEIAGRWRADPVGVRIPGGETFGELKERALGAFERIAEEHAHENIAVVAHKSVNRVIICCLLGVDVGRYRQIGQVNGCINTFVRRDTGDFVVKTVNEQGHLGIASEGRLQTADSGLQHLSP